LGMALPELQSEESLHSASLKAAFSGTASAAQVKQLQLKLDDTTLTGQASVKDFAAPKLGFDADVDQFDLDAYLPAAASKPSARGGKQGQESKQEKQADSGTTKIDLSVLKNLNLDGKLHVGKLKAYNMAFDNATLAVTAKNGVLMLKPLTSGFYDGQI